MRRSHREEEPVRLQVTFDTADPNAHDAFWAALLGYEVEDNSAFIDRLVEEGRMPPAERITVDGRSAFRDVAACVDPAGEPRQRVPEGKVARNRVRLDIRVAEERRRSSPRWSAPSRSARPRSGDARPRSIHAHDAGPGGQRVLPALTTGACNVREG